jgi:hypothetical protein
MSFRRRAGRPWKSASRSAPRIGPRTQLSFMPGAYHNLSNDKSARRAIIRACSLTTEPDTLDSFAQIIERPSCSWQRALLVFAHQDVPNRCWGRRTLK